MNTENDPTFILGAYIDQCVHQYTIQTLTTETK